MNILDFPRRSESRSPASLQFKVECYQKLTREWSQHLSQYEFIVLQQIMDRTIGWGRREAYFTTTALREGDEVYAGIAKAVSRRTLFRALASLEDRGFIRRRPDKRKPDRVHYSVNMDWTSGAVNLPKRLLNGNITGCQSDTTQCQRGTGQCQCGTLYTGITKHVSTTGILAGAPAPLPLSEKKNDRGKGGGSAAPPSADASGIPDAPQASVDVVEAAWRSAVSITFPGTAYRTWGVREKAQVKTALKGWRGDCTFPEFVTWAITNWTAIMRKQFKWMTKSPPPATPTLAFLINFLTHFSDARAENVLEDWLTAEDRTEIEKMMGRGQTWEQATAALAKTKAAAALRGEIEKGKHAARTRDYAATRKLAEAKKLAELEGRVPIHPRSPAALRMIEEERAKARPQPTKVVEESGETLQGAAVYFVDPDHNPFDD